jgi:hypothetical protein
MPPVGYGGVESPPVARCTEMWRNRYSRKEVKCMRARVLRILYTGAALATLLLAAGAKWKAL